MNQGGSNRGNRLAVCDSPDRELEAGAINPVILSSASVSNSQFQISPANDPLGRRASTTVGDVTVRHVYDGAHCVADTDATGTLLRSYTWGPGIDNLLAVTCHSGATATTYYALTDIQGTVHGFTDADGNLFETYAYDAWGNVLAVRDGNGLPIPNQQSQIQNRFLFQGREYSHATGLYNFRLRWYDPATGRWLSKDPIGISGGLNLYAFCGNDPVNYVDPWGLREDTAYVVVGSGVGAQHVADLVVRELQAAGWDTTQMSAEQLFEALSKGSRFNGLVLTGHGTGSEAAGIDESIVATLLKNSNQQLDLCVVLSCHGNQFANSLFADGVISDTALSISYWGYSSPAPVRNSLMKNEIRAWNQDRKFKDVTYGNLIQDMVGIFVFDAIFKPVGNAYNWATGN